MQFDPPLIEEKLIQRYDGCNVFPDSVTEQWYGVMKEVRKVLDQVEEGSA